MKSLQYFWSSHDGVCDREKSLLQLTFFVFCGRQIDRILGKFRYAFLCLKNLTSEFLALILLFVTVPAMNNTTTTLSGACSSLSTLAKTKHSSFRFFALFELGQFSRNNEVTLVVFFRCAKFV